MQRLLQALRLARGLPARTWDFANNKEPVSALFGGGIVIVALVAGVLLGLSGSEVFMLISAAAVPLSVVTRGKVTPWPGEPVDDVTEPARVIDLSSRRPPPGAAQ